MYKYFRLSEDYKSIKTVWAEKETDTSIWINGVRYPKVTPFVTYFNDFNLAKSDAIVKAKKAVKDAEKMLDNRENLLLSVQNCTEEGVNDGE